MHVRLASEARRPFSEPEWQHGGGSDTTVVLTLCEACPLADEIGRPQSRMKKMLAMNMSRNVPARALILAEFECSILAEKARSGAPSSIEAVFLEVSCGRGRGRGHERGHGRGSRRRGRQKRGW
jgi:hypothetical protein